MFTGIIEEKGTVSNVSKKGNSLSLIVEAEKVCSDVSIGDSISVNGVCLTVTSYDSQRFTVDVIPETFRGSSLSTVTTGSKVNLERAMQASNRFGGHFVSGHVDAVGSVGRIHQETNALYMHINVPKEGMKYLTLKGSISVDGTSLTVFDVQESGFVISLIPETQRATVLGEKQEGAKINIEYDMLAKYLDRLISVKTNDKETESSQGITTETLKQNGFLE